MKEVHKPMKRGNIQLQAAVRLLLEYLLEQKEALKAAIAMQRMGNKDDKRVHESKAGCHSVSSSDSSGSPAAPGSSNTIS